MFFTRTITRSLRLLFYLVFLTATFFLVACGGSGSGDSTPTADVTISGTITFDFVPHDNFSNGLDYSSVSVKPARGVEVLLINQSNIEIDSTITDANGNYSFTTPGSTNVRIRVNARMRTIGNPSWNFSVTDNTRSNALYAFQGNLVSSGTTDSIRNLHANSGWGGNGYIADRSAAPFAILDTVYDAIQLVLVENPTVNFPAAELRWSTRNNVSTGDDADGDIGSSKYFAGNMYILGDEDNDTDEYDRHVIAHEWGHYFEDQFSRSDSIGGDHSQDDRLDMRVAFSEGFGNAFSGMVLSDPIYRDSIGNDQSFGFSIDVEKNTFFNFNKGWYSEASIQSILYDIHDSDDDGLDTVSDGFGSIYTVLTSTDYRNAPQLTSAHLFFSELKSQFPGLNTDIDRLISNQNFTVNDAEGTGETNNADTLFALPLYHPVTVGRLSVEVCSIDDFGFFNKVANRQFVRFSIATAGSYTVSVTRSSGLIEDSDPDIYLWLSGDIIAFSREIDVNNETLTATLDPGDYIAEIYEYGNISGSGGDFCFNVEVD